MTCLIVRQGCIASRFRPRIQGRKVLRNDTATFLYTFEFLIKRLNFSIHLCDEVLLSRRTRCGAWIGRRERKGPKPCGLEEVRKHK